MTPARPFFPVAILTISLGCAATAADWKNTLEESLASNYELTKTGLDRVRITKAGTVLVIRKDNISGDLASDLTYLNNKVIGGTVQQAGGAGAFLQDKRTSRVFKTGEKVYVSKIAVRPDAVEFFLVSGETYDVNLRGSTRQTRYKALVSFEFDNGFLETADLAAVKKVVDDVIAPESTISAANTKTVELGQTPEQVEAALGKPDTIVNLGAKRTYVYKTMKVIFQDGKVADVQ
ncbi:MAG TPA: hypothetical protein VGR73_12610 [Bryobacteraceae bacterium]|nr:hypothetical protein [Bryobacteraceae bacterium]